MWRRVYFLLLLVRIYFALSPSYLHPDEHFQGPEVIAGTCQHSSMHAAVKIYTNIKYQNYLSHCRCMH